MGEPPGRSANVIDRQPRQRDNIKHCITETQSDFEGKRGGQCQATHEWGMSWVTPVDDQGVANTFRFQ